MSSQVCGKSLPTNDMFAYFGGNEERGKDALYLWCPGYREMYAYKVKKGSVVTQRYRARGELFRGHRPCWQCQGRPGRQRDERRPSSCRRVG